MSTLHEITKLKREVEQLKEKVARSKGTIDQMMKEYRGVIDQTTFHECLEALQERRIEAEAVFTTKLTAYRKAYHEYHAEWPPVVGPPQVPQPKVGATKARISLSDC